jgi:hypothetical protein
MSSDGMTRDRAYFNPLLPKHLLRPALLERVALDAALRATASFLRQRRIIAHLSGPMSGARKIAFANAVMWSDVRCPLRGFAKGWPGPNANEFD